MKNLQLYAIGTKVNVGCDVVGTITAITIHEKNHVAYQINWWLSGNYNIAWLSELEIQNLITEVKQTVVGFR